MNGSTPDSEQRRVEFYNRTKKVREFGAIVGALGGFLAWTTALLIRWNPGMNERLWAHVGGIFAVTFISWTMGWFVAWMVCKFDKSLFD